MERGGNRLSTLCFDSCHKGAGVVALAGDDKAGRSVLGQRCSLVDFRDLSRRQNDVQRVAQRIVGDTKLGGQTAPRPADFLAAGFFWATAEC